jgi:Flp pilus assembly protein TadD
MRWSTLCLLAMITASAQSTWLRISSPSIDIFTDTSEKNGRAVLNRFETLARVFDQSHFAESPTPLRVFVFASADEYKQYRMSPSAAAFYQPGDDRDLMVLHQNDALSRDATHEYLHMVMQHLSSALPAWLDEGVAEFYSTLAVGRTKIYVGDPIPQHLSLLRQRPFMDAEELALGNRSHSRLFYAESWALVHMLSLSPDWKNGMPQFVKLLNDGRGQQEAFRQAFGRSMKDALTVLPHYLGNPVQLSLPLPPQSDREPGRVTIARLAPVDATLALADLALCTRHSDRARSLFLQAAKDHPDSPASAAGLAALALAEHRKDDAKRALQHAIALGSRDAGAYFQLALLTNDDTLLEKTLAINPNFAEAHFLLGVHLTDSGPLPSAVDHLRQAVAIQPRRFTYWHALGYAQVKSGDRPAAAESARRAMVLATTPPEEDMAAALTLLAAEVRADPEPKPAAVVVPKSWQNPKGDARVTGRLTFVDCGASPVRLVVTTSVRNIELEVRNPGAVELHSAEGVSRALPCGKQDTPVAVEYSSGTREITRIDFIRDIMKP